MTPQEAKNIKIGIGVAAGIIVLYYLSKSNDNGSDTVDPTGNTNTAGSGINVFDANQVRLALFNAMNQVGTDEKKIVQALHYVTPAQFDLVIKAFGKERYSDYFGYKTATAEERDLLYWLNAEMSDSDEYENLQRKFRKLY